MSVQQQEKIRVLGALPRAVADFRRGAVQEHAHRSHPAAVLPVLAVHALSVGAEPDDVLVRMRRVRIMVVERVAVEIRVLLSITHDATGEFEKIPPPLVELPVIPGQLRILTVGVVVALLRAAQLVAARDHRRALRENQRAPEVALLALAQLDDGGVVRGALHSAVPGMVVVRPVPVVLAVRLVVLLLVAHQILEREAVMSGDEVDARRRRTPRGLVKIRAAREARGNLAVQAHIALPELAHRVAVLAVPLHPAQRKVADLIAALAEVPGLGDELRGRERGILIDRVEERPQLVHVLQRAGERRGQIETEPVHVHLGHPVPKAVHEQLNRVRGDHVERVAAAGEVHVVALIVRQGAVVGEIVDAAK